MPTNSEQKLLDLKDKVKKFGETQIRLEEKLKYLETEKGKLVEELRSHGIEPETIDSYLQNLEKEIQELVQTLETNIPAIPKELIENA